MTDQELIEAIDDTIRDYNLPYEDSLEYYYEIEENLEKYYRLMAKSNIAGKDLICDYISEYRNQVESKIAIEELVGRINNEQI